MKDLNVFSTVKLWAFSFILFLLLTPSTHTDAANFQIASGGGVVSVEPGCDLMLNSNTVTENEPIRFYTIGSTLIQTITIKDENGNIVLFESCNCGLYELYIDGLVSGTYSLSIKTSACTTTGTLTIFP